MSSAMNIDEFIKCVMSAMRLNESDTYADDRIESRLVKVFNYIERLSLPKSLELRFHCKLNPVTKSSPSLRYALIRAEDKGLIARDGQTWNILISQAEAAANLENTPLSKEEWRQVSMKMQAQSFTSLLEWFD